MTRFIIIRLIQTIIALIGIAVLIFVLVRLSGNPIDLLRSATSTPEQIENLQRQLGLDKSNWEQFVIYMSDLAKGDLGRSLLKQRPVSTMIGESLPNSLKLTVPSCSQEPVTDVLPYLFNAILDSF